MQQRDPIYNGKLLVGASVEECALFDGGSQLNRTDIFPSEIKEELRVAGVDKRLMLIEPNEEGHVETSILGMEGVVAKSLGISVAAVLDRVRTLRRRKKVGRTGVFLKQELYPNEGFGEGFQRVSRDRPAVRRRLRK